MAGGWTLLMDGWLMLLVYCNVCERTCVYNNGEGVVYGHDRRNVATDDEDDGDADKYDAGAHENDNDDDANYGDETDGGNA